MTILSQKLSNGYEPPSRHRTHAIFLHIDSEKLLIRHSAASSTTIKMGRQFILTPVDPMDLPCACGHLKTLLINPHQPTTDGHHILSLDHLQLPSHLRIFLNANMNSAFYPTKARYYVAFQNAFRKWKVFRLPLSSTQNLSRQWQFHISAAKSCAPRATTAPRIRAPELFQPLPHLTPLNINGRLLATVPSGLRARYKW